MFLTVWYVFLILLSHDLIMSTYFQMSDRIPLLSVNKAGELNMGKKKNRKTIIEKTFMKNINMLLLS